MELDKLLDTITTSTLFLRLKSVVEHHPGWHDHEDVYSHCIKTATIAKEQRDGAFITDSEAKKKFLYFMDGDIAGMKRKDIVVLIALLHDTGKLLSYTEDGKTHSLIKNHPEHEGYTQCPGHEYWGGTIVVKELVKDIQINDTVKNYIATVVRLHGVLNFVPFYTTREKWDIADIVSDVKAQAEGYYIEAMFNAYCDCYTASSFTPAKAMIEKIFNTPLLYTPRKYYIA